MTTALVFLSVLFPAKGWFGADQAWNVTVRPPQGMTVKLVLTDFSGSTLEAAASADRQFDKESVVELKQLFPAITTAGTYLLYAVPKAEVGVNNFAGTPLVITVRDDRRRGAPPGPMAVKVEPLTYAIVSTDAGDMTVAFYFDVAANTISNFIALARDGFYDGLTFHRIDPSFIAETGDPRGNGTGGPGYHIDAEFSDRKHEKGVLSMARNVDPNESPNNPPRPEYANSAGSQFFISLDDKSTVQLDGVYTVFAKVVGGQRTLAALAATPIADTKIGDKKTAGPVKPPVIKKIEIRPVTLKENPYPVLLAPVKPSPTGDAKAEHTTVTK